MREARLFLAILVALAAGACARPHKTTFIIDPSTGQPVPVVSQNMAQSPAAPAYRQSAGRGLFSSSPAYAQTYAEPSYQPPAAQPQAASQGRGLFTSRQTAPRVYAQPTYAQQPAATPSNAPMTYAQQRYMQQFAQRPDIAQPQYAAPQAVPQYAPQGGPYVAAPYGYASAPATQQQTYTLDSGDKLRVVVFGQDGITNSYTVDAGGNISLPLVGIVPARGFSTQQLSQMIVERLKQGYVREPHVSVEVEGYRPCFILGEVTNPGQYPYVANMTAETAIAIAGGFAPRASKSKVELTRTAPGQQIHGDVPLSFQLRPGDTILVKERWF
jgi:polysaccharide export outer membrane protein